MFFHGMKKENADLSSRCRLQTRRAGLLRLPESWGGRVRHLRQHRQPHLHQLLLLQTHGGSTRQIHLVLWVQTYSFNAWHHLHMYAKKTHYNASHHLNLIYCGGANTYLLSFPLFFPVLTSLQFSTLRSRSAFLQTRQRLRSWRPWTTRGKRCSSPRRCPRWPSTPAPSSPTCSSQWWLQGWTTPLPRRGCKADVNVFIINAIHLN